MAHVENRLVQVSHCPGSTPVLRVRKSLYSLSDQELLDLRRAFEGLYAVSTQAPADERGYQWIAGVHGLPPPVYCQHGNLNFPTWHRAYLYELELRLQEHGATVSLPYWDWASERAIEEGIPAAVADPTYVDPDSGETRPNPLASAFSQVTGRNTRRNPGDPSELQFLKDQVDFAQSVPVYGDYGPALENPHGGLHVWVGGDMGRVPTAAYDPIFWLHHCNVDRLWYEWQEVHGDDTVPEDVRQFVCAPFSYTGEQTLSTVPFGYTYADSEASATQDQARNLTTTAAAALPPSASFSMTGIDPVFALARLELHGVQKTEDSYQVRVFCDREAGAYDASIERRGNASYANTLYLFGHGECVGADGHCTRPEGPRAWYDRRPPHHLAPFNTYLDVTKAVRNSLADGSKSLDLTFVVLDGDGQQVDPGHVQFDRLSLVTYK